MAGRMSPVKQSNAREKLRQEIENVRTGDAAMDSLLAKEVGRRATFAVPSQPRQPAKSPLAGVSAALSNLFKKKGKK